MLIVYASLEDEDRVIVVGIHDARTSGAATSEGELRRRGPLARNALGLPDAAR